MTASLRYEKEPAPPSYRAVIVEDDRLAREELLYLLKSHPNVVVVGEAGSIQEALTVIQQTRPDLILLDIRLRSESGFGLLERLVAPIPVIIVTAYTEYAVQAFEVNALDFLLKPVNPQRMEKALQRLYARPLPASSARNDEALSYQGHLFIEVGNRPQFIRIRDIVFIEAAGDYVQLVLNEGQKALVLSSLGKIEERLPTEHFIRIHRSVVINLNYVDRFEALPNNAYQVFMRHHNEPLRMSRRYARKIRGRLRVA